MQADERAAGAHSTHVTNSPNPGAIVTGLDITVRSTDMDADRNANNAVYFQYFEQSRLEHLLRLGAIRWPPSRGGDPPQFALVETSARFRAPAFHRDTLTVSTRTTAVGNRSFSLAYEVRRHADGALICEGSSAQVWLDADGRPAPLPPEVRQALERSISPVAGEDATLKGVLARPEEDRHPDAQC